MGIQKLLVQLSIPGVLIGAVAAGQSPSELETKIIEWVNTERMISEEREEWNVEKETLDDTLAVMKQERESLNDIIASANEQRSSAEAERAELLESREELQAFTSVLADGISEAESRIRQTVALLPEPLQEELIPLTARLPSPENADSLALSARLQVVVGILSKIETFNNVVTEVSEIRRESDQTIEVHTLYFGLGGAYYVDAQGLRAGVGVPGANGWEWSDRPELAPQIQKLYRIYNGASAEFVPVPVTIK